MREFKITRTLDNKQLGCSVLLDSLNPGETITLREVKPIDWGKIWDEYFKQIPEGFLNNKRVFLVQELVEKQLTGKA